MAGVVLLPKELRKISIDDTVLFCSKHIFEILTIPRIQQTFTVSASMLDLRNALGKNMAAVITSAKLSSRLLGGSDGDLRHAQL